MLNLDLTTILFEILNFTVLAFLLYRFLFKPVMGRVRRRAAEKETLRQELVLEKEKLQAERAGLAERLAGLEREAADLRAAAKKEAALAAVTTREAARREAEEVHERAIEEAARWREEAIQAFEADLLDTVFVVVKRLVGRVTPAEVHDRLIVELAEQVGGLGRTEMQRVDEIRRSLVGLRPEVEVETARPLDPAQQRLFLRTLAALADRDVNLKIELADDLAAGARVRLGDLLVDHSLAGQVEALREMILSDLEHDGRPAAAGRPPEPLGESMGEATF